MEFDKLVRLQSFSNMVFKHAAVHTMLTITGPSLAKNELEKLENWVFHKNCFFIILNGIQGVWRFPGWPHRAYGHTCKFSADLVLHGIEKSTFQHFPVNWQFKVLEMALKTFHFVPGLSRTPLLFFPRYFTNIFFRKYVPTKNNLENRQSENLKIRSWKVRWFVFSQRWTSTWLSFIPQ